MSTPRSDELLFATGGDVWEKYGTFVKRTLPEEERGTFSRSSDATYTDRSGNLRTAESGVLRPHYVSGESSYSARLEAARTNELHNSDSPATQTRSLTAGTYTLWMEGSGSVDASGATDGYYGTATEGQSNDLTFTVSAQQDVTFTVNNTVTRFQCEEGSFRSSFIATAGSAVSRAADSLTFPISFGPQELTVYVKFVERGGQGESNGTIYHIGDSFATGPRLQCRWGGGPSIEVKYEAPESSISQVDIPTADVPTYGDVFEVRQTIKENGDTEVSWSKNGGGISSGTDSGASIVDNWNGATLYINSGAGLFPALTDFVTGPIIAPGVRTLAEMRSIEV